jgi:uncharacterized LabA/DUF88 family protein
MKKTQNNYAFVDGQNLNLAIQDMGWKLDFRKFRIYLAEKYGVGTAYYFIGFVAGNTDLYKALQLDGYILIFKPTFRNSQGTVKGNCDAELVLQAMIDLGKYERAVIVTGDGDFACLVKHLSKIGKLECVLAPNRFKCSHLLNISAGNRIAYMNDLRQKLGYGNYGDKVKKKRTP